MSLLSPRHVVALPAPYWAHSSTASFEIQKPGTTSKATRGNPLRLIVALSPRATAWGDLFWDDGESLDTFERGNYSYLVFNATEVGHGGEGGGGGVQDTSCSHHPLLQNIFTSNVLHASTEATYVTIDTVSFYGMQEPPSKVLLDGQEKPFSYLDNQVWPCLGVLCPGGAHPSSPSPHWWGAGGGGRCSCDAWRVEVIA